MFSRKQLLLLIGAVVIESALFTALASWISSNSSWTSPIAPGALRLWQVGAIVLSAYSVWRLWYWPRRMLERFEAAGTRSPSEARGTRARIGLLLISSSVLTSPNLYGLILVLWGMPSGQFWIYPAISVLGAVLWAASQFGGASRRPPAPS